MAITSVIVQVQEGQGEAVCNCLAGFGNLEVFGEKDDKLVAVIDTNSKQEFEETVRRLYDFEDVIGVYPVYTGVC